MARSRWTPWALRRSNSISEDQTTASNSAERPIRAALPHSYRGPFGTFPDTSSNDLLVELVISSARRSALALIFDYQTESARTIAFGSVGALDYRQQLSLSPGVTEYVFSLDGADLADGAYMLSVDLTIPNKSIIDRVDNCLSFEIVRKSPSHFTRFVNQQWGYGSFRIATDCVSCTNQCL